MNLRAHLRIEMLEARIVFDVASPTIPIVVHDIATEGILFADESYNQQVQEHVPGCHCNACVMFVSGSGENAETGWALPPHYEDEENPAFGDPELAPPYPGQTLTLHSRPSSLRKIYLDFTGHTTTGTSWNSSYNNGNPIITPVFNFDGDATTNFTELEQERIQRIWQRMVEDFSPFDVDVTTEDPGSDGLTFSGGSDASWGIRVIMSGDDSWIRDDRGAVGGMAYVSSFKRASDVGCFVFANNLANFSEKSITEAASHEVGHTLGLNHDGTASLGYYSGHSGSGTPGWAPIMGVGYYQGLTQWSRGEYSGANNTQDDLAIITNANANFGYRPDDAGNTISSATPANSSGLSVSFSGVIETTSDVDVLSFYSGAGSVSFNFNTWINSPNLDIKAELRDSNGNILMTSDPQDILNASISTTLPTIGTYYLFIEGVGVGSTSTTGYSDYASLGQYTLSGTIAASSRLGSLETTNLSFLENQSAIEITASVTISPGIYLNQATVAISNYVSGQDSLLFTDQSGISGNFNASTGLLTLTGTASPAAYQAALRSVTYANGSNNPTLATRVFTFQVRDTNDELSGSLARDLTITAVNDAPTLSPLDPVTINEDSPLQTLALTGITAGGGESQALTIVATSSNTGLIPHPTVVYTSPDGTGTLRYTPVANAFGTATITVTLTDNGGTANGGVNQIVRTFVVTINAVNDAPTLSPLANVDINQNSLLQTIALTGISAGDGESQTLSIVATSSNTALIPHPTVVYSSPDGTGTLRFTPVANASGTATITVTLTDNGGTANGGVNQIVRTFVVTVNAVNDAPTLSPLDPVTINEDSPLQTLALTGITAGGGESQTLTIVATSSNTGLIPHPTVVYSSPDGTGTLRYTPVANAFGTATITVTLADNGGTANGGVNQIVRTFVVTVNAVNDAPSFVKGSNVIALPNTGLQTYANWASLMHSGASNESDQVLNFVVTHGLSSYFSRQPEVNSNGDLTFTPAPGATGTVYLTIYLQDNGGTSNGGDATSELETFTIRLGTSLAPTLDNSFSPALIPVAQNSIAPNITQITDFALPGVSDTDSPLGIAITGDDSTNGQWQYSLDGGVSWVDFSGTASTAALQLRLSDHLRFLPVADFTGRASLIYHAWDSSTGTPGSFADLSTTGGTSPYSVAEEEVIVRVAPTTTSHYEDERSRGNSQPIIPSGAIVDNDVLAKQGIAVIGAGGDIPGVWQYSINRGRTWKAFSALTPERATLLRLTDRVRFIPASNAFGEAYLIYRAWDQTAGVAGSIVNLSNPSDYGDATPFSSGEDYVFAIVKPKNDKPVLDRGTQPSLTPISSTNTESDGDRVASFLGSLSTDVDRRQVPGIAVTGFSRKGGEWWYQVAGGSWLKMPLVSLKIALLLEPEDKVRFVPDGTFVGTASLKFKAWDRELESHGTTSDARRSSTFSSSAICATLAVGFSARFPDNTAPTLDNGPNAELTGFDEDSQSSGDEVATLLTGAIQDADAGAQQGIAITGLSGTTTGVWLYSLNRGETWRAVGLISESMALMLRDTDRIRYLPNPNFNGSAQITYRAWDRTSGSFGKRADLTLENSIGGSTAFSLDSETAEVTIRPLNDQPVLDVRKVTSLTPLPVGALDPVGNAVSELLGSAFNDADLSTHSGIAITKAVETFGDWEFQLAGSATWQPIDLLAQGQVLYLDAEDRVRFKPEPSFSGSAALRYFGWDQSEGAVGSVGTNSASSSLSRAVECATIAVNNVNSPPLLDLKTNIQLAPIRVNETNTAGFAVSMLLCSVFDNDPSPQSGIAVIGLDNTHGRWERSLDGGSWQEVGLVSASDAYLLKSSDRLRFVPNADFAGVTSIRYKAWDQTDGVAGTYSATRSDAFSAGVETARLAVNSAPLLTW